MTMNVLLEAQKDFEGIEKFISAKFGIPMEARIMAHDLNAANIDGHADESTLAAMRDEAENFIHSNSPLDLKLQGAENIDLNDPPKVVTLVSYIRNAATAAMTHEDEFGIGDSQRYRNRDPGSMAGFSKDDLNLKELLNPETYPVELKNYIAMLSRQYLPGILRIAFNELNLMSYLVRIHPDRGNYMGLLPDAVDVKGLGKFSYKKLEYLGKTVVPIIVVRELISRSQPGKFKDKTTYCDPSTLAETRAYLGDGVTDIFVDFIDPPAVNLDANLADRDGAGALSLAELVNAMDIGDEFSDDTFRKATRNSEGKELRFTPESDDDAKNKEHELFSRVSEEEFECPAYKAGQWYVVQVPDLDHSEKGWFNMPESPSGRFYFRGGADPANYESNTGYGVDKWCIVASGMFYSYVSRENNDYAYYYVHESATRTHSSHSESFAPSAFGVVYSGTDSPDSGRWTGLARSNQDRSNSPALGSKEIFKEDLMKFFPMRPSNQLKSSNYSMRWSVNNTIGMLCLIGQWDNSVRGEENIQRTAQELSLKWFPPKPGVEMGTMSVKYASARDADEAGSILATMLDNQGHDNGLLDSLKDHKFTINIGNTQWAMLMPSKNDSLPGYYLFVPYDNIDDFGDDTPALIFRNDPDANSGETVVPLTDAPIQMKEAAEVIRTSKQSPEVTPAPSIDKIDGMYLAPAFGGNSGKRRIAIGQDGVTLYAVGPETEGNPEPIGQLGGQQTNARNILDRRATYFAVDGGYNICIGRNSTDTGDSPIKYIGFARDGKKNIQMFSVNMVLSGGNLLLETPGAGTLRLGNLGGDLVRQREDRYGSFLFCIDNHTVVDGVNLVPEALSLIADRHAGDIGMVTISGDFMANLASNGLVGTVDWFDSATLSNKGQSRLTANMLNRNARETPSVMHV